MLPNKWSAATISSFVCGRPDRPMFASMYMCLWKEVTDDAQSNGVLDELYAFVDQRGDVVEEAARDWRERAGFSPHPCTLFRSKQWPPSDRTRKRAP